MAYTCELTPGQRLILANVGEQTTITLASGDGGQQQQASSQFTTGGWTAPPAIFQTGQGHLIQLTTQRSVQYFQVQGQQLQSLAQPPSLPNLEPVPMNSVADAAAAIPPLPPMAPLPPMRMDNMAMNAQPMQMRMDNMTMQKGNSRPETAETQPPSPGPKFCSQCGSAVQSGDRFCAQCGHQLQR
ncbi:MAG: zinc-ribbon domain-containing protein [Leptolyngbyaceae cyanobacterium]